MTYNMIRILRYTSLLIALLICTNTLASSSKRDSLFKVINSKDIEDKDKVSAYIDLAKSYCNTNFDSLKLHADSAFYLSVRSSYKYEEANARFFQGVFYHMRRKSENFTMLLTLPQSKYHIVQLTIGVLISSYKLLKTMDIF